MSKLIKCGACGSGLIIGKEHVTCRGCGRSEPKSSILFESQQSRIAELEKELTKLREDKRELVAALNAEWGDRQALIAKHGEDGK